MTREEIILRLKKIATHAIHFVGEEPFVMSLDDGIAVHEAIEILEQPEQRWIPVRERLPEEQDSIFAKFKGTDRWNEIMWEKQSQKVLVTVEYEDGTRAVEVANTFDGKWKYRTAVVDRYPVAWCHFPEPYKEVKE